MSTAVSGLAASIRKATESETFDLAGSTPTMIEHMTRDAFTQPFDNLTEMIRLTFITGAGKLGRAKYDDNAARTLTNTLRELGYTEDRGASAILDCAGSYKLQHDTGKNLKTVVVFPKVSSIATNGTNGLVTGMGNVTMNDDGNPTTISSLIEDDSIDQKLIQTSMKLFPKLIETKCETWQQKKSCLQAITKLKQQAETLDQKLIHGQPLTDPEQEYYNTVSITALDGKCTYLKDAMTSQVDLGQITTEEKKLLLEQIADRITILSDEIQEAETENKIKRIENLKLQLDKVKVRQTKIQSITPILPPRLKNEDAIMKLRKEQVPLIELEKSTKGRLLTLKESQSIARKEEIDLEIQNLQLSSRQWYETDTMFQARIKVTQSNWEKTLKQLNASAKKKGATSSTSTKSSSTSATTKWVLPNAKKPMGSNTNKSASTKSKTTSGGLFAAMMNDDSDSD